jgi:apolipoprotein D and lipocalin family protein
LRGERTARVGCAVLVAAALSAAGAGAQSPSTVAPLSALRGSWYEIASYGSSWQRRCVRDRTLAVVTRSDNDADLRSRCRTMSGIEVRAGRLQASGADGQWRARFAPAAFGWLPAVWDDFWVLGHDRDLKWFMVGERHHQRLAVYSRTVALDESALAQAMGLARQAGFDPRRLVRVMHDPDEWRTQR